MDDIKASGKETWKEVKGKIANEVKQAWKGVKPHVTGAVKEFVLLRR